MRRIREYVAWAGGLNSKGTSRAWGGDGRAILGSGPGCPSPFAVLLPALGSV